MHMEAITDKFLELLSKLKAFAAAVDCFST